MGGKTSALTAPPGRFWAERWPGPLVAVYQRAAQITSAAFLNSVIDVLPSGDGRLDGA